MDFSVIVPVFNEENNLPELFRRLVPALENTAAGYEIIFVDDGSRDGTFATLKGFQETNPNIRIIRFRANYGQHAAILAGIKNARGRYICSIDADLQNDPEDIKNLLAKIDEGYDVVKGIRVKRNAPWLRKRYSYIANKVLRRLVNRDISDYGCTFGLYSREIFDELFSRGRLPKYILLYAFRKGVRVAEIPVNDFKRRDSSRYDFLKLLKVFTDLVMTFLIYSRKGHQFFKMSRAMSYASIITIVIMLLGGLFDLVSAEGQLLMLFLLLILGMGQLLGHMMIRKHILEYDTEFGGEPLYEIEEILPPAARTP